METQAHYTRVGFFVIVGMIATIVFALWLSQLSFHQNKTDYDIYFKGRITGLKEGSSVEFRGVPIGTVKKIRIDPDNLIRVLVAIDSSISLRQDAIASLETQGLTGISYIQIEGGKQNSPPLKAITGHRRPIIPSKSSLLEEVSDTLPQLLGQVSLFAKELRALLSEENRTSITNTLHNLEQISHFFAPEKEEKKSFYQQIHETMKNVNEAVNEVKKAGKEFQFILKDNRTSIRDFSSSGLDSFNKFLIEGQETLSSLRRIADGLTQSPTQFLFPDSSQGVPTE